MLLELMATGHLRHWWEYVVFIVCMITLVTGPAAIWLIMWAARPLRRARKKEGQ